MPDVNDIVGMDCRQCREAISARLDGEATAGESVAVDVHLVWCADCRAALERAERVTRMARECAVEPSPDPATVLLGAWDAVRALGAPECGCGAGCACGCQSGSPCRCQPHAA